MNNPGTPDDSVLTFLEQFGDYFYKINTLFSSLSVLLT